MNRRTTLLIGLVAGVAIALLTVLGSGGGTALADGGPHVVQSGATPDKCAGCHRIHTGQNEFLLKEAGTIEQFCYSCHGNGGPGSDLAVQEGTFYGGTTPGFPYGGKTASTTVGLRAGGFEWARINTTDPNIAGGTLGSATDPYYQGSIGVLPAAEAVNSWHAIDGTTAGTLWGNGAFGSGAGPSYTMECTSCHDPHGNGQYRILRPIPQGSGAATGVLVADIGTVGDQASKNYTTTNYLDMGQAGYTSPSGNVAGFIGDTAAWCAQCHTRYLHSTTFSPTFQADRSNGGASDSIYTYSHGTSGFAITAGGPTTFGGHIPACETCHAEHGSNAQMPGTYSSTVPWPGGGLVNPSNDTQRASLLKVDNRGMCRRCHPPSQVQ